MQKSPMLTAANTFEGQPGIRPAAITVTVTTDTQFEDDVDEEQVLQYRRSCCNTDFVEVRGYDDGKRWYYRRRDRCQRSLIMSSYRVMLQAASSEASNGTITVFGITFDFDNSNRF